MTYVDPPWMNWNELEWIWLILWAGENPFNGLHKNSRASRVKNRPEDQKTDFLGKKKTILGHFFRKSLLNRPKSVKTDHITDTVSFWKLQSIFQAYFRSKIIEATLDGCTL